VHCAARHCSFILSLATLVGCASAPRPAPSPPVAQPAGDTAWSWLTTTLPGRWQADADGARVHLEQRLISGGTVLLQTFTGSRGGQTITVFHRDGAGLLATHYCAQGNQPRLRATVATSTRVELQQLDVTDLGADEDVLERLVIERDRATGAVRQTEVYRGGTTTLTWTREGGAGAGGGERGDR
jgi:hypothetical protein